jgi:hypothetical protein
VFLDCTESTCAGDCCWCEGLPELLKRKQSHWLCRAANAILFRGKKYNERAVNYIMQLHTPHDGTSKGSVASIYQVPSKVVKSTPDFTVSFWPLCEYESSYALSQCFLLPARRISLHHIPEMSWLNVCAIYVAVVLSQCTFLLQCIVLQS